MSAGQEHVLIDVDAVDVDSPSGRPLFRGLSLSLSAGDRVALIRRNGVGKSTLLALLAGRGRSASGQVIAHTEPVLVEQMARAGHAPRKARIGLEVREMTSRRLAHASWARCAASPGDGRC